ncbi:restriction endonuclease subunit S [Streptococcus massiliensis]|uniref:Type I restriction-modification system, specificity determinant n=1 Tax=Streptococcus massiliensis TaxID=313439 RepID=A0A380L0D0_9STRE|nr:restriction endonuclease subunit S [Streptococcus massiliensis]SUN76804.1 type I restriction-modification system, specificity determinant [Streptococcus massiliensis]
MVKNQLSEGGSYPVYQNSLTPLGFYTEFNRRANQSIVICAGAAGEVAFIGTEFWAADDVYTMDTGVELVDKFLYYVLLSKQYIIKSKVRKASIPRLSKNYLENIEFYLPSLEEQLHIVSVLDKFDTLTSDLSQGLPKEIALRQKQYEYFRDQLLKFKS